jgi:hypothetical protein
MHLWLGSGSADRFTRGNQPVLSIGSATGGGGATLGGVTPAPSAGRAHRALDQTVAMCYN